MKKPLYPILCLLLVLFSFSRMQAQHIVSAVLTNPSNGPDTLCFTPEFRVMTSANTGSLTVNAYFSDGTSDATNVFTSGSGGVAYLYHYYGAPGTLTTKFVLNNAGAAIDSTVIFTQYQYCNSFYIGAYHDANNNCIYDTLTESPAMVPMTVQVDSNGHHIDTLVTTSGFYYKAYGPVGTVYAFTVLSAGPGANVTCPAGGVVSQTIQSIVNGYSPLFFGVTCNAVTNFDLSENVNEIAGTHHSQIQVLVSNSYCSTQNATLTMHHSPKYNFVGASIAPTSINGNTLTWSLVNVSLINQVHITVDLEAPSTFLLVGDTVHTDVSVTPTMGDVDPANNYVILVDTVTGSYDPNEKSVMPQGNIRPGSMLTYTIAFENTGNDTAFNIHVVDTLSSYLDAKSLKMITASAPMNLQVYKHGQYTIADFEFANINLPDSTHTGLNTGMLRYTINAKEGLADGTRIDNRAGIYFDYNPVVITNTVENMIGYPAVVSGMSNNNTAVLYPNPTTDQLTIKPTAAYNHYTITNTIGQTMVSGDMGGVETWVSTKALAPGIYFISLRGEDGVKTMQFEKR